MSVNKVAREWMHHQEMRHYSEQKARQKLTADSSENTTTFQTGAVRSADAGNTRYDLISPIGLRRLAETYAEGSRKYSDHNWLKGLPCGDTLNHLMRHIELWRGGDRSEDHLAHAAWGLFALMHFDETRPDLMNIPPWYPEG